ncbi:hypothetical protein CXG81DRAFT_20257 [Caulochytrium protostelioides]|uniref:Uncharacterized protein n=1 Tax=Caulochytrium protostelioides TaxID=1555241 RepID=A0A4P9X3R4_9FUNG|nr:hypothetical protein CAUPRSCDRAFT_10310 [Caulochytrium protostelioides]RKO99683.1 hypothetical protein CXG81DRAFT_20257 [Caulochytrium protostelioides]|eukprot:RKO99683.1 hypothetical protein CXG81DRAFT_20257 [Caulochytrium protostelioides]
MGVRVKAAPEVWSLETTDPATAPPHAVPKILFGKSGSPAGKVAWARAWWNAGLQENVSCAPSQTPNSASAAEGPLSILERQTFLLEWIIKTAARPCYGKRRLPFDVSETEEACPAVFAPCMWTFMLSILSECPPAPEAREYPVVLLTTLLDEQYVSPQTRECLYLVCGTLVHLAKHNAFNLIVSIDQMALIQSRLACILRGIDTVASPDAMTTLDTTLAWLFELIYSAVEQQLGLQSKKMLTQVCADILPTMIPLLTSHGTPDMLKTRIRQFRRLCNLAILNSSWIYLISEAAEALSTTLTSSSGTVGFDAALLETLGDNESAKSRHASTAPLFALLATMCTYSAGQTALVHFVEMYLENAAARQLADSQAWKPRRDAISVQQTYHMVRLMLVNLHHYLHAHPDSASWSASLRLILAIQRFRLYIGTQDDFGIIQQQDMRGWLTTGAASAASNTAYRLKLSSLIFDIDTRLVSDVEMRDLWLSVFTVDGRNISATAAADHFVATAVAAYIRSRQLPWVVACCLRALMDSRQSDESHVYARISHISECVGNATAPLVLEQVLPVMDAMSTEIDVCNRSSKRCKSSSDSSAKSIAPAAYMLVWKINLAILSHISPDVLRERVVIVASWTTLLTDLWSPLASASDNTVRNEALWFISQVRLYFPIEVMAAIMPRGVEALLSEFVEQRSLVPDNLLYPHKEDYHTALIALYASLSLLERMNGYSTPAMTYLSNFATQMAACDSLNLKAEWHVSQSPASLAELIIAAWYVFADHFDVVATTLPADVHGSLYSHLINVFVQVHKAPIMPRGYVSMASIAQDLLSNRRVYDSKPLSNVIARCIRTEVLRCMASHPALSEPLSHFVSSSDTPDFSWDSSTFEKIVSGIAATKSQKRPSATLRRQATTTLGLVRMVPFGWLSSSVADVLLQSVLMVEYATRSSGKTQKASWQSCMQQALDCLIPQASPNCRTVVMTSPTWWGTHSLGWSVLQRDVFAAIMLTPHTSSLDAQLTSNDDAAHAAWTYCTPVVSGLACLQHSAEYQAELALDAMKHHDWRRLGMALEAQELWLKESGRGATFSQDLCDQVASSLIDRIMDFNHYEGDLDAAYFASRIVIYLPDVMKNTLVQCTVLRAAECVKRRYSDAAFAWASSLLVMLPQLTVNLAIAECMLSGLQNVFSTADTHTSSGMFAQIDAIIHDWPFELCHHMISLCTKGLESAASSADSFSRKFFIQLLRPLLSCYTRHFSPGTRYEVSSSIVTTLATNLAISGSLPGNFDDSVAILGVISQILEMKLSFSLEQLSHTASVVSLFLVKMARDNGLDDAAIDTLFEHGASICSSLIRLYIHHLDLGLVVGIASILKSVLVLIKRSAAPRAISSDPSATLPLSRGMESDTSLISRVTPQMDRLALLFQQLANVRHLSFKHDFRVFEKQHRHRLALAAPALLGMLLEFEGALRSRFLVAGSAIHTDFSNSLGQGSAAAKSLDLVRRLNPQFTPFRPELQGSLKIAVFALLSLMDQRMLDHLMAASEIFGLEATDRIRGLFRTWVLEYQQVRR